MASVTKLFLSNRSQAVRIPAHLRLPDSVKTVEVRACGQERIISPVGQRWDSFSMTAQRYRMTSWSNDPARSSPSANRSESSDVA